MSLFGSLYHYCSTESFVSIISGRSLRLSSLRLSNDTKEGRLVNETVMRMAEKDGLDAAKRERLKAGLEFIERLFDGLGFCLSETGDLLSQWRGYADDACGVSIGFNAVYLKTLAESYSGELPGGIELKHVVYEPEGHEAYVWPTYSELRGLLESDAFKPPGLLDIRTPEQIAEDEEKFKHDQAWFLQKLVQLGPRLYELKSKAFREEEEWRLVSIFTDADNENCSFMSSKGRIIPYREIKLKELKEHPITEVILGPKHETPPKVIESLLRRSGFEGILVRRSDASYR